MDSMTPKEKAEKLTDSFLTASFGVMEENIPVPYPFAKQCALIAVEEILNNFGSAAYGKHFFTTPSTLEYWQEVKEAVEKFIEE